MAKSPTEKAIAVALLANAGVFAAAARALKCNRSTIGRRVAKSKKLQELVDEIEESTLDIAEGNLKIALKAKHWGATKFYLETKGKHRGYTRQLNLTADKPLPVIITHSQYAMA